MTRRQRRPAGKKKRGVLMGMRSGVKKVAGKVGVGEETAAPVVRARWVGIFWNVVTGLLVVAAGAMWLRKCGVIHF
jgi:hypothetical protein